MGESQLIQHKTGHFGFSAVGLDDLGASEYTLVTIVADRSGSTQGFQQAMEKVLKELAKACVRSDRADNLMIRLVAFEDFAEEVHGFKLLSQINQADYDGVLHPGGMTALYDAAVDAIEATTNYAEVLAKQDYMTNGFVVVITDGMDNRSKMTPTKVKEALAKAVKSEFLESIMSILVAVNVGDTSVKAALQDFNTTVGFTQYVELNDADEKTFAKMANWLSQSVSSQSSALGTGGPSTSINF
jgi:uncharacterized protein YegL